jgi:glycine/D-amino acid oxidase-like deaminating enzyme
VAAHGSKVSGEDFAAFIPRLGIAADEIDPERWFRPGTVDKAFVVEEPSFDSLMLAHILGEEIRIHPGIQVSCGATVVGGSADQNGVRLELGDGSQVEAESAVLATYAGTNGLRETLGLDPLPIAFELAEVVLGDVEPVLQNMGFTVMDGPFWSLMPFGHSDQVTLTSVGLTPLRRNQAAARFSCQEARTDCTPVHLADCSLCPARPASGVAHMRQQLSAFLKSSGSFTPRSRMLTVKAVLRSTEVDDSRPTVVTKDEDLNVWTVFSGKVSTLFELERELP